MAVDVAEDCSPSAALELPLEDDGDGDRDDCSSGISSGTVWSICWRICCVMCVSENGRFVGGEGPPMGLLYVSTVFLTAVVISSREV